MQAVSGRQGRGFFCRQCTKFLCAETIKWPTSNKQVYREIEGVLSADILEKEPWIQSNNNPDLGTEETETGSIGMGLIRMPSCVMLR